MPSVIGKFIDLGPRQTPLEDRDRWCLMPGRRVKIYSPCTPGQRQIEGQQAKQYNPTDRVRRDRETLSIRMTPDDRSAGMYLLEKGTLVDFKILDVQVMSGPDDAEFGVRINLRLGEEDDEDSNDVEWGGIGFCFVLAILSFADTRPRGASELDYRDDDQITLLDFMAGLGFVRGELHFSGDCIRGRRLKTDITVRPDGTVTLETVGRGKAALVWLDRLKGKAVLSLIR